MHPDEFLRNYSNKMFGILLTEKWHGERYTL